MGILLETWRLFYSPISRVRASPRGEMEMEDADVKAERLDVYKRERSGDILKIWDISKDFRNFFKKVQAVHRVTVGIKEGEVSRMTLPLR